MNVPLYGQKYRMSCWAASMRMILAAHGVNVGSDDDIAAPTDDQHALFEGLDPNANKCLTYWGFRTMYPQTFTEFGFSSLVDRSGPLWVACDVRYPGAKFGAPHIRVVKRVEKINGSMTLYINDPAPIGDGSSYKESYYDFVMKNELLGSSELNQHNPIYVAYIERKKYNI